MESREIQIFWFLASLMFFTGSVAADKQLSPAQLLQEILDKGPDTVFSTTLTGYNWSALLKNVESGEKPWLAVAAAIYPATHAGPAEDLSNVLGIALLRAPEDVLEMTASVVGVEGICGYPNLGLSNTDTQEKVIAYLDVRIQTISNIKNPNIAAQKTRCIESLKKTKAEVLRPNGPFSESTGSNCWLVRTPRPMRRVS